MIKSVMKSIRRELLKVDWIKREVEAYLLERKLEEYTKNWAEIMHAGLSVRELKPVKLYPWDTFPVVGDNGTYEERLNGKVVARGWIDSCNWGGIQS